MEGVGLVTGFQFLLGLAAVFAENAIECVAKKSNLKVSRR